MLKKFGVFFRGLSSQMSDIFNGSKASFPFEFTNLSCHNNLLPFHIFNVLFNVGIGTTSPSQALEVNGNISTEYDNAFFIGNSSHKFRGVYTYNLYTTDTIFSNNFRITEPNNDTVRFTDNNNNPLLDIGRNSVESKKPFRVNLENTAPFACDTSREGFMYFNKDVKAFKGCNGSEWRVMG